MKRMKDQTAQKKAILKKPYKKAIISENEETSKETSLQYCSSPFQYYI